MSRKRKGQPKPEDEPARDALPGAGNADAPPRRAGDEPAEPAEYTELVLLVHAANMAEAELFKAELESHNIPAVLEGEGAGVAGIPDVGAGVPVLVPEELADEAAELIAELESAKPEENDVAEEEETFEDEDLEDAGDEDLEDLEDLDKDEDLEEDEDWEDDEDEDWEDDEDEDWEDDEDDD